MKKAQLFAGALLACGAMAASAAELSLFGQELRTVDRASLRTAAKAAGAKLASSDEAADRFSVDAVGLPGAQSLEVVYLNGQVVLAQYTLEKHSRTDESFRKMLVSKYGPPAQPTGAERVVGVTIPADFDKEYISDGKYRWKFDKGMEMVFTREFFGARYLTYVNKPVEAKMQRLLAKAEKQRAVQAAQAKSHAF